MLSWRTLFVALTGCCLARCTPPNNGGAFELTAIWVLDYIKRAFIIMSSGMEEKERQTMVVETPRELTRKLLDKLQQLIQPKTVHCAEDVVARDRLFLEMRLIRARWEFERRYDRELADDWPLLETLADTSPK